MLVEVENLSKKYHSQEVVKNLTFSMDKGEIVGFLGPNGAGKSTTLKIITGCIPADKGSVRINGIDLGENPIAAKYQLGFLPEENPLYTEMYIPEYLEYVAGIYRLERPQESIDEVIRQTGLQKEINKKIAHLSKGYKQRVGLAQALIHRPGLLVLDEPTSGLDPNQTEEINQLLLSLSREQGILFSSHTLSEVATICTRIILIHQGEIVVDTPRNEIGDLEALFKRLTKTGN